MVDQFAIDLCVESAFGGRLNLQLRRSVQTRCLYVDGPPARAALQEVQAVVDLGGAFGTIIGSLVNDIIMPPIGLMMGGVDFSQQFLLLRAGDTPPPYLSLTAATEAGAVTMNYGVFINAVISVLIIAFSVFMLVRQYNRLKAREEDAPQPPPEPPKEELLLTEIRDILRASR